MPALRPSARTLRFAAALLGLWLLLGAPALITDRWLDTPFGLLFVLPLLSVYLFHAAGIPGLLQHDGACGWGWCSPTAFGLVFVALFWLALLLALASLLARLSTRVRDDEPPR